MGEGRTQTLEMVDYGVESTIDRSSPSKSKLGPQLDFKPGLTRPPQKLMEKILDLTIDVQ